MNSNKVILISVDGMRPDGFLACNNPYIEKMMELAYYTLDGQTVQPSVTGFFIRYMRSASMGSAACP